MQSFLPTYDATKASTSRDTEIERAQFRTAATRSNATCSDRGFHQRCTGTLRLCKSQVVIGTQMQRCGWKSLGVVNQLDVSPWYPGGQPLKAVPHSRVKTTEVEVIESGTERRVSSIRRQGLVVCWVELFPKEVPKKACDDQDAETEECLMRLSNEIWHESDSW